MVGGIWEWLGGFAEDVAGVQSDKLGYSVRGASQNAEKRDYSCEVERERFWVSSRKPRLGHRRGKIVMRL